jgi:hypothetical protein
MFISSVKQCRVPAYPRICTATDESLFEKTLVETRVLFKLPADEKSIVTAKVVMQNCVSFSCYCYRMALICCTFHTFYDAMLYETPLFSSVRNEIYLHSHPDTLIYNFRKQGAVILKIYDDQDVNEMTFFGESSGN